MIHLDSSFLVDLLREMARKQAGPATAFLNSTKGRQLGISVFVACELFAGAQLSHQPSAEVQRIQQVCDALHIEYPDQRFAPLYGTLLARLERADQGISVMDLLIATSAILSSAQLVTRNLKDFSRVPGLGVLDY
ncbi:MAG: type II toxin-antitoxin system VapC family toxin [Acidobacteria bacterium]|nr:type II toxin-antitoxin system VapC family toxin [Acidobacteriota bacterium]